MFNIVDGFSTAQLKEQLAPNFKLPSAPYTFQTTRLLLHYVCVGLPVSELDTSLPLDEAIDAGGICHRIRVGRTDGWADGNAFGAS